VRYSLNDRGFPGLSSEELRALLDSAFSPWEAASCLPPTAAGGDAGRPNYDAGGERTPIGLTITQNEHTTSLSAGPQELEPNENVIAHLSRSEWTDDRRAFAITKIWYNARNGHILGADMLFNGNMDPFGTCPPAGCSDNEITDFRNVATHEVGHFLGLAHSDVDDSTMWCDASPGETTKRDLAADDVDGLCSIYAEGVWPGPGAAGRSTSASTCSLQSAAGAGHGGSSGHGAALVALLPLGLLAARRRRR